MKKVWTVLVAVTLIASLLVGCTSKPSAPGAPEKKEMVVRFNDGTEPETLDPAKSTGIPEANIEMALNEGLTRLVESKPTPALAGSWTVSSDGLTYTFKLRDGIKWANGDPITAADFEYSWKRALDPRLASEYAYQLYYIKGGEKLNTIELPKDWDKDPAKKKEIEDKIEQGKKDLGIKVVDPKTLEVTLEAPTAYWLSMVAFPTLYPVYKKNVEADPDKWFTKPETYNGAGPFKMESWTHNEKIVMVRNPNYWDAKNVKIDKLVFTLVDSLNTEMTMFETDQIDMTSSVPTTDIDRLRAEGKLKIGPLLGTYYYRFNVTKPPLDNVKVRQALTLAIDRASLIKNVVKGGQAPALAFVPGGVPDVSGDFRQNGGDFYKDNDLDKAKKLLAEAGYPDGKGFPELTILYNTSEGHKKIAEAIQEMWKKNLGINVKLTNQEWKVYLKSQAKLDYQVSRAGWIGDYLDPMTFVDMFVKDGGNNQTGWANATYDKLVSDAKKTGDQNVRMKNMHEAEKILMDEQPVLPIYFYVHNYLKKDNLKGVQSSALGFDDFKAAYLESK